MAFIDLHRIILLLLISEFPNVRLQTEEFLLEENKNCYLFLIVSIPLLIFVGLAAVIGWYIILCWFVEKEALNKSFWHGCCTIVRKTNNYIKNDLAHVSHLRDFYLSL